METRTSAVPLFMPFVPFLAKLKLAGQFLSSAISFQVAIG
jgi:hypothetical protein